MQDFLTLEEISKLTNSVLIGDPNHKIRNVNCLESATEEEVSFLSNPRYKDQLNTTCAGAICIDHSTPQIEGKNYLVSDSPSKAFQILSNYLISASSTGFSGVHESAVIHSSATIEENVFIGPNVTVDKNSLIKSGTKIYANVSIGPDVEIGNDCVLYPSCVVRERCQLKNRVTIQPGAVIGSCGFGYITDKTGCHNKIEQLGNVVLEDDVEIGANTTIDRARFKSTVISRGSKIDNLVQIGHNCHIGESNLIVALSGISGSSKTGKLVIFGGQVGVVGHVEVADYTTVASRGGITKTIKTGGTYGGNPLVPIQEYHKQRVHQRKLPDYNKRISDLESQLLELQNQLDKSSQTTN